MFARFEELVGGLANQQRKTFPTQEEVGYACREDVCVSLRAFRVGAWTRPAFLNKDDQFPLAFYKTLVHTTKADF